MADTYTPNFNLTVPEPNASRDTWGKKTNDNWGIIDNALKATNDAVAAATKAATDGLAAAKKDAIDGDKILAAAIAEFRVPVYTGSDSKNSEFPIGTTLLVALPASTTSLDRNSGYTLYFGSGNGGYRISNDGNGRLNGTWRQRGGIGLRSPDGSRADLLVMMERTA